MNDSNSFAVWTDVNAECSLLISYPLSVYMWFTASPDLCLLIKTISITSSLCNISYQWLVSNGIDWLCGIELFVESILIVSHFTSIYPIRWQTTVNCSLIELLLECRSSERVKFMFAMASSHIIREIFYAIRAAEFSTCKQQHRHTEWEYTHWVRLYYGNNANNATAYFVTHSDNTKRMEIIFRFNSI